MSQTVFRSVALERFVGAATMIAALALEACTVTTPAAQPEVTPDPSATPASLPTTAPSAPASISMPPIAPHSSAGDWTKPNPNGKALGEACTQPGDCKSGVCEGQGCDVGPKCVDPARMCTRDLVGYCGCDGKPFSSSGSCAGRPYKNKGNCN